MTRDRLFTIHEWNLKSFEFYVALISFTVLVGTELTTTKFSLHMTFFAIQTSYVFA